MNIKDNIYYWPTMALLLGLKRPTKFREIRQQLNVPQKVILSALKALRKHGIDLKLDGENVIPAPKLTNIQLDLTPLECLLLNYQLGQSAHHFESLEFQQIKEEVQGLIEKIGPSLSINIYDDFKKFNNYFQKKKGPNKMLNMVELAIRGHRPIDLWLKETSEIVKVFPYKLVYFAGGLCLIAEGSDGHALQHIKIKQIKAVRFATNNEGSKPQFTAKELEDFVNGLRSIDGKEIRLILKINSRENIDLMPKYHHLGNPCMVVNNDGDLIWAATVEPCKSLYHWLYGQKDHVEVIDPGSFKRNFEQYCSRLESHKKAA